MSLLRKRQIVDTLLTSTNYSPKEITRRADVSLATVYNVKSRQKLEHKNGTGRPKTFEIGLNLLCANKSEGNHFYPCGLSLRNKQLVPRFR